jgi:hypothetical protein
VSAHRSRPPSRWAARLIAGLTCLGGLALLSSLVWQVGMVGLRLSVQALGLWLVPFLLLDSVSLWLHTVGWQASFRPDQHALRLWQLGVLRLAGSAVNWVIPVAGFGGEVVKVLLLEATMPRTQAAASVVIDKTSFLLAQMFYLVLGMLCLIKFLPLPDV